MTPITKICQAFGKQASHYVDNKGIRPQCTIVKGRYGAGTEIPESLLPHFLWWLSEETRTMLHTQGVEKTLEFAKRYKKI